MNNYQPVQEENDINLTELLDILIDGKWLIILITLSVLFLGTAKAFLTKPAYKTDIILQVDEKPRTIVRIDSETELFKSTVSVRTVIEQIKSRAVLGEVIKNMRLDIAITPKYFPPIGEAIARQFQQRNQNNTISEPVFGLSHYAWGGEVIRVDTFAVPENLNNEELTLLAGEKNNFQVFFKDKLLLEGKVGKLASKQIRENEQPIIIFVSRLKSRPGTQFIIKRLSKNVAIDQLDKKFHVREKGQTGILELTFEAYSPDQAVKVLNEIANIYVQQNVEYKSAESQKALEFLAKQLPKLKNQVELATFALNDYRVRRGSIDLDIETQNILRGLVDVKTQTTLLQQKRDELKQRFTESHANVIAINKQIFRLKEQARTHNNIIKALPETQQIIVDLSGNLEVSTNLYRTLLNKAQELEVAKSGTVGDVRVIDFAILPDIAIKPKRELIIGVALVFGVFLGIAAVFLRRILQRDIEDPNFIEKQLGIPVYATVPYSKNQGILNKEIDRRNKSNKNEPILLAKRYHEDNAIESLRSFRTALHFSLLGAKNNIILISGPSPNIGKTFIAANLATVMADSGKKVLLIDADLRKGAINKSLGVNRENGLSEIILNIITIKEATHKIPLANIAFIPAGALPPNPSELLLHEHFGVLLEVLTKQYDLIIIDSPPILAATDAAIISQFVSETFIIVKYGQHTKRELEQSIKIFSQSGTNIKGIVFNGMPETSSLYGYSYNRCAYQYNHKK